MGIRVVSVKPKCVSLGALTVRAMKNSGGVPAHIHTTEHGSSVEGFTFPLEIRVRTIEGICKTDGLYRTRTTVRRIRFESGLVLTATKSHKLMRANRTTWVKCSELEVGTTVATLEGSDTVLDLIDLPEIEVADVCVPGPHSYLLENGIVSHNSILANQLNINQSELGYKSILVPLEMSNPEMLARSAASISGMPSLEIFLKRMATGERDHVWKKFTRFDKRVAKANGRYTIFKPREDLTIEELMASLHTFNSDVIYVDYIGLLKGADGEDQWRRLGQIARFCKIYAESNNKVVVLLVQISEEGRIRYSQAIKEHASLAWVFVATKESKERGYLNIELLKSRNQSDKPFTLSIDYQKMHVRDLSSDELKKIDPRDEKKSKDGSKKTGKSSSKDGDSSNLVPGLEE